MHCASLVYTPVFDIAVGFWLGLVLEVMFLDWFSLILLRFWIYCLIVILYAQLMLFVYVGVFLWVLRVLAIYLQLF